MKKILYILAAVCLLASCEKAKDNSPEPIAKDPIVGDWHCTSVAIDAEIYVTFKEDNTFVHYQQIGEGAYRVYNGTYNLEKQEGETVQILTGSYNDGSSWGSSYELVMGENSMTLSAAGITETYDKLSDGIPSEVVASSVTVVKSDETEVPFF